MKKKALVAVFLLCLVTVSMSLLEGKTDGLEMQVRQEAAEDVIEKGQAAYKDWEWELLEDGTITVTRYHGIAEILEIPAVMDGKKVAVISKEAFMECSFIKEVRILGGVREIGEEAFYNCRNLKNIVLMSDLKTIGAWAFLNCEFTEVLIPSSVTDIGEGAFEAVYGLKAITVAAENEAYSSEDGVLYNKEKTELVAYPGGKTQAEYEIPSGVAEIGRSAFGSNSNLRRVLVPESVRRVKGNAFCRAGLQEIIIQNPTCVIEERRDDGHWETTISYGTKIYGYEDSTAQSYAEGHGNSFKVIQSEIEEREDTYGK